MQTLIPNPSSEKDLHVPSADNRSKPAPTPAPQMGPILKAYTLLHTLISLVAIATGLVVLGGMLVPDLLPRWTSVFLWTTVATNVTGFFFPYKGFKPSYAVAAFSLLILWAAVAGYNQHALAGAWRWIYVVTAVLALFLNVVVLIVQSFGKIPALKVLAPTQTEPIFKRTLLAAAAAFLVLGTLAVLRFHA